MSTVQAEIAAYALSGVASRPNRAPRTTATAASAIAMLLVPARVSDPVNAHSLKVKLARTRGLLVGLTDGFRVGWKVGEALGCGVVGASVSLTAGVGTLVGECVGLTLGLALGDCDGLTLGLWLGETLGPVATHSS